MNYTRILILLVIWNLLPNCFPLPSAHRAEIDKVQSHVAAGTTTKEEIISILGEPDVSRDTYILYVSREYDGGWWPMWGCIGPQITVGREYMNLYFEFNDHGTLTDYRVSKSGYEVRHQCNLDQADCLNICQIKEETEDYNEEFFTVSSECAKKCGEQWTKCYFGKETVKKEKVSERIEEESISVPIEEDCDPEIDSCI